MHTNSKKYIDSFNKSRNILNFDNRSANIVENQFMSEYSSKWKSMLGNQFMSDVTVFTKEEHEIPVHSLVFFVHCPNILDDIITEELNMCKSKQTIMWLEYSYEACFGFLELIYSGQESYIVPEYRDDYLNLCIKYNIPMTIKDDHNAGWVSNTKDTLSKRKSPEFSSSSADCKRYKTSSPDMFLSNDVNIDNNENSHFLGLTVDDEKSLGILKTKQWLYSCNRGQLNHNSSFTENESIDVPSQTICPIKSPSHSFHSASTISLQLTSSKCSNYKASLENIDAHTYVPLDVNSLSPKSLSSDKSSVKATLMWQKNKNVINTFENNLLEVSTSTNTCKRPEIITISDSDSDGKSIDMIFSKNIKTPCNSTTHFNFDSSNEHNDMPIFQSCKKKEKLSLSDAKYENHIKTFKINDNSSHLVHSANTNMLYHNNWNTKLHNSSINNLPELSPRNKILIQIDDEHSISSTATNMLSINNANEASNSNNFIDLVEESSDSVSMMSLLKNDNSISIPLSNIQQSYTNSNMSYSNITNHKRNFSSNPIDLNEENNLIFTVPQPKLNLFSNDNISYSSTTLQTNFDWNSPIFSKNTNLLKSEDNLKSFQYSNNDNPNSDSKQLENTLIKTSMLSQSNNCDSHVNTKDNFDLSNKPTKESILIKSVSIHNEPINEIDGINSSKITILNENDHKQNISLYEQIINDPWMDYWQPATFSPQYISPVLSENNSIISVDKLEVQTPNKKVEFPINLVSPTSANISNCTNKINSQNKNALTPNKFGNKVNTPKSLRRVQSESIIGSKEQVTPLPDYSTMKTPDLRVSVSNIYMYVLIIIVK